MKNNKSTMLRGFYAFMCIIVGIVVVGATICYSWFKLYDVFYVFLFVVCLEVCLLMSLYIGVMEKDKERDNNILGKAYYLKAVWLKSTIIWTLVNYWMISSSLLATVIVIYISSDVSGEVDTSRIIFYSIASLFVSVMNYALTPMAMSRGYRKAFLGINRAILQYECMESPKEEQLAEAIAKGEECIDTYTFEMKT